MPYSVYDVTALPDQPLAAASSFYTDIAPSIRHDLDHADTPLDRVIIFAPGGHEHDGWRLAAVQELARVAAPVRINAVVGANGDGVRQALDFLAGAPGITGQMLRADG